MKTDNQVKPDAEPSAIAPVRVQRGVIAQPTQKCAISECGEPACCELAVDGEWFPICMRHSQNRFMPRRGLSYNVPMSHPRTTKTP
jgi:hypothetical protein